MKKILSNRYIMIALSLVISGILVDSFVGKYINNTNTKMIVTFGGTIVITILVFKLLSRIVGISPEE